jgi:hypothetical protein
LEKRFNSRFSLISNYTYSKSLDNQSVDNQFTVSDPDPFDSHFNYGLSDFDTPHNLSIWGIYDLPRLNAAPWLLRALAGGWETAGALAWRSGTPFTVISGQDRSFSGVGQDRADLVGDPIVHGDRSRADVIAEYFNPAAFVQNAVGTFGNSARNLLRGPGLFNLDWSVQKSFGEAHKASIRADFFNVFNNVHLNAPGSNVSSASTFGKITSAGDPRILQLALRYQF